MPDPARDALAEALSATRGLVFHNALPTKIRVVEFTPKGHATRLFGIVADYGWAERILFSDAYEKDALAIAEILRFALAALRAGSGGPYVCDTIGLPLAVQTRDAAHPDLAMLACPYCGAVGGESCAEECPQYPIVIDADGSTRIPNDSSTGGGQ